MSVTGWVYLDGTYMGASEAKISPFDRGFLFAQAAYEVTAVYNRALVDFDLHRERLFRTLQGLEIDPPTQDIGDIHEQLIERNDLQEGLIYLNVSAGMHGLRDFSGPEILTPSVFAFANPRPLIGDAARDGISAISMPDTRWQRRDLKTTQLVSQSLAYRAARRAGATTAILHENGVVTEAASANVWMVTEAGQLVTRDLSRALLPGVTRARLISLFQESGPEIQERRFSLDEMSNARELFTSSAGAMIAPVLSVDGVLVGDGRPGPVTRQVQAAYYKHIGVDPKTLGWL
ncbi:MAG: aminotransferase class IV [Pseudomonadota bacterium]